MSHQSQCDFAYRWCQSIQAQVTWHATRQCRPSEEASEDEWEVYMDETTLYESVPTQATWWASFESPSWDAGDWSILGNPAQRPQVHLSEARQCSLGAQNSLHAMGVLAPRPKSVAGHQRHAERPLCKVLVLSRAAIRLENNWQLEAELHSADVGCFALTDRRLLLFIASCPRLRKIHNLCTLSMSASFIFLLMSILWQLAMGLCRQL